MRDPDAGWSYYVDRFHAERPGVSVRILSRCRSDGLDPSDERRTFRLPIDTVEHAAQLLHSLYLPDIAPQRLRRAHGVLAHRISDDLAVPLRRAVLERSERGMGTADHRVPDSFVEPPNGGPW